MDLDSIADQPMSRLLTLPAELRNRIYEELLVHKNRPLHAFLSLKAARTDRFCANVLRTCKQVYREAIGILYGSNTFLAHSTLLGTFPSLLLASKPHTLHLEPVIHPRVTALIRRYYLQVRLDTDPRFTQSQAESCFNGVEALELHASQAMYGGCDFSNLRLFEGVRGVGKAVVGGSVGDGKYAQWLEKCMMSSPGTILEAFSETHVGAKEEWGIR